MDGKQFAYEVGYAHRFAYSVFGMRDAHLLNYFRGPLGERSVGAAPHCVLSFGHCALCCSLFPTHSATTTHHPHPVCWAALHRVVFSEHGTLYRSPSQIPPPTPPPCHAA